MLKCGFRRLSVVTILSVSVLCLAAEHGRKKGSSWSETLSACGNTTHVPYTPRTYGELPPFYGKVRDQCKGAKQLAERLLVTSTFAASVEWMLKDIPIPFVAYFSGSENATHRHPNVGYEAMGYLTFIAEYYDCLPNVTIFAHPHKSSYHTYQDLNLALRSVHWPKVPGYITLHPLGAAWAEFNPWDSVSNLDGKNLSTEGLEQPPDCFYVINGTLYEYWPRWEAQRAEWIAKAWDLFFGPVGLGPMPPMIRAATTAEFFVRKARIRLHSRDFYVKARNWIIEAEQAGDFTSWQLAVVFELLWHYILGEPAFMSSQALPPCELYRCAMVDTV